MQIPISFIPDEDGGYTAICSIYPVITEGDTIEEAEKNMEEALSCHVEGLRKEIVESPELHEYEVSFMHNMEKAKHQFISIG